MRDAPSDRQQVSPNPLHRSVLAHDPEAVRDLRGARRNALAAPGSRHYGAAVTRFVTDTSLEFLAHRLVFLGYDVTTIAGARLEDLFEAARREARTVLTLSARHPRRFVEVAAIVVPRGDVAGAL
ncbi:MAG TPA: Mut7-C RNAse domain-containing protein, partial [Candidatus Eisenbacteria bacterium]|nr:Mut7-C RNAse domain-containing protein [Candidatus Eisenbacteria bacterium]